ncbi:MAG: S8 family serine peptidase [Flavobacteriales bacterium]
MKTNINLSILLTGMIGLTALTAEAQNTSRVWARITDKNCTPRIVENGTVGSTNGAFADALNQVGVSRISQALPSSKNENLQQVYEFDCQCDETQLTETLKNFPGIVGAIDRAPEYHTLYVPNDYFAAFSSNYALDLIKAPQAWNMTHSNANIVIGISDENLNPNHEELAGKITYYDVHNTNPMEHGTAVAILAAGKTENGVGLSSVGFNSSIAFYQMSYNELLNASYAGIDVINISWFSGCSYNQFEQDVIDEVYSNGTFIVAAAGNGSTCGDATAFAYPASYNHVFAVTSIGSYDNHEEIQGDPMSTHQHNYAVDLSAPGYKVNISESPDHYLLGSGTSYAAPFVTGTVALMLSVNPCLDNDEIEQVLKNSANDIDYLNVDYAGSIGAGRLNANAAVSMAMATQGNMDVVATVLNGCSEGQGAISVSPTNGQEPYTTVWGNGLTGTFNENLPSGDYTIQVIDAHGCIVNTTASINNSTPVIDNSIVHNVVCQGGNNGSISLSVSEGNPTYSYTWSNSSTGNTASNLSAGSYNVTVSDINGCNTSASFDVTEPLALTVLTQSTPDLGNFEGSIDLTIDGGTPGYSFEWSNGATSEDLTGLTAGSYEVFITDANGCQTSTNVEITNESSANTNALVDVYLNVYPNPSHGDVKISWKGMGAELLVVTQTGSQVLRKKVYNTQMTEVFDLAPGVYTLKLIGVNGGTATKQLVIL